MCGAVLLPVVMIYGAREMEFVLRRSGAAAVVVPREHRGRQHAAAVLGGLSGLRALKFAVIVGEQRAQPRRDQVRRPPSLAWRPVPQAQP